MNRPESARFHIHSLCRSEREREKKREEQIRRGIIQDLAETRFPPKENPFAPISFSTDSPPPPPPVSRQPSIPSTFDEGKEERKKRNGRTKVWAREEGGGGNAMSALVTIAAKSGSTATTCVQRRQSIFIHRWEGERGRVTKGRSLSRRCYVCSHPRFIGNTWTRSKDRVFLCLLFLSGFRPFISPTSDRGNWKGGEEGCSRSTCPTIDAKFCYFSPFGMEYY